MQVDKLVVVIDADTRPLSRALKNAIKETKAFSSEMGKIGTSADKAAKQATNAFDRVGKAMKSLRADGAKGMDFKVTADTSGLDGIKQAMQDIRTDAGNGAAFKLTADASGLQSIKDAMQSIRDDASNGATFKMTADASGVQEIRSQLDSLRSDAANGIAVTVSANTEGLDAAVAQLQTLNDMAEKINNQWSHSVTINIITMGADQAIANLSEVGSTAESTSGDVTINVDSDTAGANTKLEDIGHKASSLDGKQININVNVDDAAATAKLSALQGQMAVINGRRITVSGSVDSAIAQKLPAMLGSVDQQIKQTAFGAAALSQVQMPLMMAAMSSAATAATGLAGAAASLGVVLGSGLAAGATTAYGALGLAVGAIQATKLAAGAAVADVLGLGQGFGSLSAEVGYAEKQVSTFQKLVDAMPAGTDAATNAQNRLAIAQQYETDATQLQIEWWGQYGEAANSLATSFGELRLALVDTISTAGGELIPTMQSFVDIANAQMPTVTEAFQHLTEGVQEGTVELQTFLGSAQGMQDVSNIIMAIGDAAGPTFEIMSNGAIIALQAIQPLIPMSQELLNNLALMSHGAAEWAQSAEGMQTISDIWATMAERAQVLAEIAINLGAAMAGVLAPIFESGMGDRALQWTLDMSAAFRELMSSTGEGQAAVEEFMTAVEPALAQLGPLAIEASTQFLRMANEIAHVTDEATGMSVLEEIFIALKDALEPLANIFIEEFAQIGPLMPPLIAAVADWAETFMTATPEMEIFIGLTTQLLEAFNSLPEPMQQAVARAIAWGGALKMMGGLIPGVNDHLGTMLATWSGFALATGGKGPWAFMADGLRAVGAAALWATGGLGTLVLSMAGVDAAAAITIGSIASIGAALVALAALAFVVIDIVVNIPDMVGAFESTYTDAREGGAGIGEATIKGMQAALDETTIGSTIHGILDAIKGQISDWRENAGIEGPSLGEMLFEGAEGDNAMLTSLQSMWDGASAFLSELPGQAAELLSGLPETIGTAISDAATWAGESASSLVTTVVDFISQLPYNAGYALGSLAGTIVGYIVIAAEQAGAAASQLVTDVGNFFYELPGNVGSFLSSLPSVIGGAISSAASWAGESASGLVESVVGFFSDLPSNIGGILSGLPSTIGGALSGMASSIGETLSTVPSTISGVFSDAWSSATEIVGNLVIDVVGFFLSLPGKVVSALVGFVQGVVDGFMDAYNQVVGQSIVPDMINAIVDWFTRLPGMVLGAIGDFASWLIEPFQGAWDALMGWLGGLVPDVSLIDIVMGAAEAGGDIAASLLETLGTAWDSITEWIGGLVPDISLMDALMGTVETGGDIATWLLDTLQGAWDATIEWIGGLVPDISFMDAIMGAVETGGDVVTSILETLQTAWDATMEWIGGLVPEISFMDAIMGAVETGGDLAASVLESMQGVWDAVTEWMSGLVPDVSLMDVIMGAAETGGDIVSPIIEQLNSLWDQVTQIWQSIEQTVTDINNSIWTTVTDIWNSISTTLSETMNYIWNDIIVAIWTQISTYLSETMSLIYNDYIIFYWDAISTYISDTLTTIYNDYIVYYWDSISTYISDTLTTIYNDYIVYYWDSIATYISDTLTTIYNDYIIYYWDSIATYISDTLTTIYNDYIIYYWDLIGTYISDTMTTIYNDYIIYYWDLIATYISDTMTTIYNDYIVYYWDLISTYISETLTSIQTTAQTTWDAIIEGVSGFASTFETTLVSAFQTAVSAAGAVLAAFVGAIGSALTAIGDPLGIAGSMQSAADSITAATTFEAAKDGMVTEGFASGGMGTSGQQPRMHLWNEQMGGEAYIAQNGPKGPNRRYAETAVNWLGGAVYWGDKPHAEGGVSEGCGPGGCERRGFATGGIVKVDKQNDTTNPTVSAPVFHSSAGTSSVKYSLKGTEGMNVIDSGVHDIGGGTAGAGQVVPYVASTSAQYASAYAAPAIASANIAASEAAGPAAFAAANAAAAPAAGQAAADAAGPAAATAASDAAVAAAFPAANAAAVPAAGEAASEAAYAAATPAGNAAAVPAGSSAAATGAATGVYVAYGNISDTAMQSSGSQSATYSSSRHDTYSQSPTYGPGWKGVHESTVGDSEGVTFSHSIGNAQGGVYGVSAFEDGGHAGYTGGGSFGWDWDDDVDAIVNDIYAETGAWPASYPGHPGGENRSVDWWNDSGYGWIDPGTASQIIDLAWGKFNSALGYTIWNGEFNSKSGYSEGYNTGDPTFDHTNHVHTTWGPLCGWCEGSGESTLGAFVCNVANTARGMFNSAISGASDLAKSGMSAVGSPVVESFGSVAIDSIEAKTKEIAMKLPGCSQGDSSVQGGTTNDSNRSLGQEMAGPYGWDTGTEWEALDQLWTHESNWDHTATNPESGAFGIPQALGHGDIGSDPASQIGWGLGYISSVYGTPSAAWQNFLDVGAYRTGGLAGYAAGGVIPGLGPQMMMAHGGERILPKSLNQGFEALASEVSNWRQDQGFRSAGNRKIEDAKVVDQLERIEQAIDRWGSTPSPVTIDNTDDLKQIVVGGAFAAMSSTQGADIVDKHMAEAQRHFNALIGVSG